MGPALYTLRRTIRLALAMWHEHTTEVREPARLEPVSADGHFYLCPRTALVHTPGPWARRRCVWCMPVTHEQLVAWQLLAPLRSHMAVAPWWGGPPRPHWSLWKDTP